MKLLLIVISLACFSSCYDSPKSYDESRELIPNPEGHQKDTFIQAAEDTVHHWDTVNKPVK